jgi:hypothetical protein
MHKQRLFDNRLHAHLRIQRTGRVLENELQVAALRQLTIFHRPREQLTRVDNPARRHRHKTEHRPHEGRLARARLTDHSYRFAPPDCKADVADRLQVLE